MSNIDFWRNEWETVTSVEDLINPGPQSSLGSQLSLRPKWTDVYRGYPKNNLGTDDKPADDVFKEILGDNYDTNTFSNACATRVSLGFLEANFSVRKDFLIQKGKFKGKGFIASAVGMKNWLLSTNAFKAPDVKIDTNKSPYLNKQGLITLGDLQSEIGNKNGVYIIIPYSGCFSSASGHVTLWVGSENDVIGGHNYAGCIGQMYFWELL
jgi:hypothetical protein